MNIEVFREYCISKKGVTEEFPFDQTTLVFKVMGKMFALCRIENFETANLKCDPEKAVELREEHPGLIIPGFHMSKKHWNTVSMNEALDSDLTAQLIDDSYNLVVKGLTKKLRTELETWT